MAVTAEEGGLKGSEFYAKHPLVPVARTAMALAMALTACQRNRRPIETATRHASALDQQMTFETEGGR